VAAKGGRYSARTGALNHRNQYRTEANDKEHAA